MPARYVIDKERRLVTTTVWDRLTFAEAKAHQDQLASDPEFRPEFNQLIDATKVTRWDMPLEDAKILTSRRFFSPASRRALVAKSPAIFGVGKLMQAYLEFAEGRAQVCVFYNCNDAMKWLGLDSPRNC